MTLKMKLIGMAALATALLTAQAQAGDKTVLKTQTDRESYSNGVNIARTLKQQSGVVNLDVLIHGMKDELTGDKLLMTEDDLHKTLAALQADMEKLLTTEDEFHKTLAALQTDMARKQQAAAARRGEMKAKASRGSVRTADAAPRDASTIKKKEEDLTQKTGQSGQIT